MTQIKTKKLNLLIYFIFFLIRVYPRKSAANKSFLINNLTSISRKFAHGAVKL